MQLPAISVPGPEGRSIELRSPQRDDAGIMLAFLRELLHESADHLNAPANSYDGASVEHQAEDIERLGACERDFFLSAFDDGRVVGNLLFNATDVPVSRHCGQLALGVLQSHQGMGLASALLGRCIDEATRLGIWNIRFTVRTYNQRAIALYERHGFRRVGRLEGVARIGDAFVDEFLYQGLFGR